MQIKDKRHDTYKLSFDLRIVFLWDSLLFTITIRNPGAFSISVTIFLKPINSLPDTIFSMKTSFCQQFVPPLPTLNMKFGHQNPPWPSKAQIHSHPPLL